MIAPSRVPLPPARITACRIAALAHCHVGRLLFGSFLLSPDAVRLRRREKDVIERARWHEIDDRSAARVDMVDPAARDGAAEENRKKPIDRPRRARCRFAVSGFGGGDLGLDQFGMRPAAAGGFMHAPVVQQFVDDESFGVEAVPVAKRLQRLGDRRIPAPRETWRSGEEATTIRNDGQARICVRQSLPAGSRRRQNIRRGFRSAGWKKRAAIIP